MVYSQYIHRLQICSFLVLQKGAITKWRNNNKTTTTNNNGLFTVYP